MKAQMYVLIIEDSTSQALRLQLILKRAGYAVGVAHDGAEGWEQACQAHPDIILLDVNLPELNGFEVLALLKQGCNTHNIPVVMLTSQDRVKDVERAFALGADGYLFKDDCMFSQIGGDQIVETIHQFRLLNA